MESYGIAVEQGISAFVHAKAARVRVSVIQLISCKEFLESSFRFLIPLCNKYLISKAQEFYEFLWRPEVFLFALSYPEFARARAFGGVLEDQGALKRWLLCVVFDGEDEELGFLGMDDDVEHY